VPHDPAYSDRARVSVADRSVPVGPMADATRPGRHLRHLARSGKDVPRPSAFRRAASITPFITDHDNGRARCAAEGRASLLVGAARRADLVALGARDEVRAIVAGVTFDIAPCRVRAPSELPPSEASGPGQDPPSRTVRLLRRHGRHPAVPHSEPGAVQ
jgi:hypothetical protein